MGSEFVTEQFCTFETSILLNVYHEFKFSTSHHLCIFRCTTEVLALAEEITNKKVSLKSLREVKP